MCEVLETIKLIMADLICPGLLGAGRAAAARGAFSFRATWSSHLCSAWKCLIWKPANEHESSLSLIFVGTGGPSKAVQLAAVWGIQFSAWIPVFLLRSPTLFKVCRCVTDTQQPSQQREHYEGRPQLTRAAQVLYPHTLATLHFLLFIIFPPARDVLAD